VFVRTVSDPRPDKCIPPFCQVSGSSRWQTSVPLFASSRSLYLEI